MRNMHHLVLAAGVLFGAAACGGGEPEAEATAATQGAQATAEDQASAAAPTPPAQPGTAASLTLEKGEIDAYVRGMQKELELLRAAAAKLEQARAAKDDEAEMSALMEMANAHDEAAAQAAGLSVARWQDVRRKVTATIGGVDTRRQMQEMAGNTDGMTDEQRAEHERNAAALLESIPDPYANLDPEVVGELKARHDELVRLNAESIAARMNAR